MPRKVKKKANKATSQASSSVASQPGTKTVRRAAKRRAKKKTTKRKASAARPTKPQGPSHKLQLEVRPAAGFGFLRVVYEGTDVPAMAKNGTPCDGGGSESQAQCRSNIGMQQTYPDCLLEFQEAVDLGSDAWRTPHTQVLEQKYPDPLDPEALRPQVQVTPGLMVGPGGVPLTPQQQQQAMLAQGMDSRTAALAAKLGGLPDSTGVVAQNYDTGRGPQHNLSQPMGQSGIVIPTMDHNAGDSTPV